MSALRRIRENIGLVAAIIALALLAFVLTDFITGITSIFGGPPNVGSIAGEDISAVEFSNRYNDLLSRYDSDINEATRYQLMDQTWDAMVSERVFEEEFDRVGLEVTGTEVYDMFAGENISPIVRQYFQSFFAYQGKEFNADDVKRYLEVAAENEQERERLRQFEDYLVLARGVERYLGMVSAGYVGSEAMAQQKYSDQNRKVDLRFLGINYSMVPDSLFNVTDGELRSYINENEKTYEQEEEVIVRFAKFEVAPLAVDSTRAYQALAKWKTPFSEAKNDSLYTQAKSRNPYAEVYQPISELPVAVQDSMLEAEQGEVFGPILQGSYYKLFKLVGSQSADKSSLKIAHILFTPDGATPADSAAARSEARQIRNRANAGNFAQLAEENSDDFSTRLQGGELGWYREGSFGEEFDEALSSARVGSIIGPIKSNRGYHVVRVLDQTRENYDIAEIEQEIYAGSETNKEVYREANMFAAKAQASNDINQAGTELSVNVFESNPLTKTTNLITGIDGGREVVLWALKADMNELSPVIEVGDAFVVAQVIGRTKKGLKSVDAVREEVTRQVLNRKKADYIKEKLAGQTGELEAIRDAVGMGAFINTATGISFSSNSIPGVGSDYLLVGVAASLQEGETTEPIAGRNGVYILQATKVTEPAPADPSVLASMKAGEVNTGKTDIQNKIEPALIDLADVEDNRAEAGF